MKTTGDGFTLVHRVEVGRTVVDFQRDIDRSQERQKANAVYANREQKIWIIGMGQITVRELQDRWKKIPKFRQKKDS